VDPLLVPSILCVFPALCAAAPGLPSEVDGTFSVRIGPGTLDVAGEAVALAEAVSVAIEPPPWVEVRDERWDALPIFNPQGPPWRKAVPLRGVEAQECAATGRLDPASVRVKTAAGDGGTVLELDNDYELDGFWGNVGRKDGGAIGDAQPVFIDYRYSPSRIDSIVVDGAGKVSVLRGTPHVSLPRQPDLPEGLARAVNVWVPGAGTELSADNLFPILADAYPEPEPVEPSEAERLLPKTMAKLRNGETLKVLAWGDSVTVGTYVPDPPTQMWQCQFVIRLRERFPKANIELTTVAWGGRNTDSFLAEPPGSEFNYQEQVLDRRPDLIVSEFVNDAGFDPPTVEQRYSRFLADFQGIDAEWAILTPHYVRPDWMGLTKERDCDDDPRPYVAGLREFAAKHGVALGDASKRWAHLWREGIPYTTLLMNNINHPDERGMKLFADALMELFPAE